MFPMNKKYFSNILFCIFLITNAFVGKSQNYVEYHKLCNEAAKQIEMGMLLPAQGMLMHAFSLVPEPKAIDLFHLAKCWSQNENVDSTRFYLKKALKMDPRIGRLTRIHNLWFEPVFGITEWEEIKASTEKFELIERTEEESKILFELADIDSTVMKHRRFFNKKFREDLDDSLENQKLWRLMDVDDSMACVKFDAFIAKYPDLRFDHIQLQFKLQETIDYLQSSYIETHEEWFYEQLQKGIIDPKFFIDAFHTKYWRNAKRDENGVLAMDHYFFDNDIDEEEQVLIDKFGCYPDYNIVNLRSNCTWPY